MYIYKHKTTGAVIESPTPCAGENWEPVQPEKQAEKPADAAPKKKTAAKRGK